MTNEIKTTKRTSRIITKKQQYFRRSQPIIYNIQAKQMHGKKKTTQENKAVKLLTIYSPIYLIQSPIIQYKYIHPDIQYTLI